jgi:PAS domain S-box-containing protein
VKHKDGTIVWVKANGLVIRDAHDQPLRMVGLNQDITERKELELRLRESEEKFAKFFRLSPDAIDLTQLDTGVTVECNQSYLNMYGYTREELIGHSTLPGDLNIWVNKEDRDRHLACVKEHGMDREFEAPLRRRDGSTFIGIITSSLVRISGEAYNLSICRDISERKKAEAVLKESEARNRALIRAIPDLIFLFSREGKYLSINASNPSLLVDLPEKLLNQNIIDILPLALAEQYLTAIKKTLDLKVVQIMEYSLIIAGEEFFFEARLAPSSNDQVVVIVRDMTAS